MQSMKLYRVQVLLGVAQLWDPLPARSRESSLNSQEAVKRSADSLHSLRTALLPWTMPLRRIFVGSLLQQLGLSSELHPDEDPAGMRDCQHQL